MWSSFAAWAFVTAVCAAIVMLAPTPLRWARSLIAPILLPAFFMVVAGFVLFGTDQGRDLGTSMLGASLGQLALLFAALVYWAAGTWHTARLGLNRRFGGRDKWRPEDEMWLRWLPRLLGVGAHAFAAASLALATRDTIDSASAAAAASWFAWLVAYSPLILIAVGTVVLWYEDLKYVRVRRALDWVRAAEQGASARLEAAKEAHKAARRQLRRATLGVVAAGLVIAGLLHGPDQDLLSNFVPSGFVLSDFVPSGFAGAMSCILASASVFLLLVGFRKPIGELIAKHVLSPRVAAWARRQFDEAEDKHAVSSIVLAMLLSFTALGVGFWAWWDPVDLGERAGSMVIGFFAFGAYIALIDLARILCGAREGAGVRFSTLCGFLLLLAVGTSVTRDFHRVRLCGDPLAPCGEEGQADRAAAAAPAAWDDPRPTVEQAAQAWFAQAARGRPDGEAVPMLVVATAGGGIRAAYWTATILARLEKELGAEFVRRHLFAVSGVSGGSVGAVAYAAARKRGAGVPPTDMLDRDFLAPALAAAAFVDGPSTFLPDFGQGDRGYALERAWEVASEGVLARPFLSLAPSWRELQEGEVPWRPALLLNATHQATGRRIIASHLKVEPHIFLDSFDAYTLLGADMPASAAAHNSARFTYVSPAGKLVPRASDGGREPDRGFVLDGGYFENFGAMTALQVVRAARDAIEQAGGKGRLRPVILQISSDPSLDPRDRARLDQDMSLCDAAPDGTTLEFQRGEQYGLRWRERDDGPWLASTVLNELVAPVAGVLASRVAHGTLASEELAYGVCAERLSPPGEAPRGLENRLAELQPEAQGTVMDAPAPSPRAGRDPAARADTRPEFAHLAMCDDKDATVPPLGWTLSPVMRKRFAPILDEQCGNKKELERLLAALDSDGASAARPSDRPPPAPAMPRF